jgi:glycine/D-amino acid oxidase-like deaminating enzyme
VVVGGGLTGLWAALLAREEDPSITLTRRALAKADRDGGRRGPWLRALDRLGMGFDS